MALGAVEGRSERAAGVGTEGWKRAVISASPALPHGLRLTASVLLALCIAYWLQLDQAHWDARFVASGIVTTLNGQEDQQMRTSRRALIGRVIALDPTIDQALGERRAELVPVLLPSISAVADREWLNDPAAIRELCAAGIRE